jgi:hypothetical protein
LERGLSSNLQQLAAFCHHTAVHALKPAGKHSTAWHKTSRHSTAWYSSQLPRTV